MRELTDGLWCIDHDFQLMGAHVGLRTTILRLSTGQILLHSPGALSAADVADIRALGPIAGVFAPNAMHHMFLRAAHEALGGEIWVSAGLSERLPQYASCHAVSDTVPEAWGTGISIERIRGVRMMHEIALFHAASRTLCLADFAFNVHNPATSWTKFVMWANAGLGKFGPTRVGKSMFQDKAAIRASLDVILSWDFDRITVCHGDVVESGGHAKLAAVRAAL